MLLIGAVSAIRRARVQKSTPPSESDGSYDDLFGAIDIAFSTKEMGDRQAKAWHDAIIGCGGKAVPDKLY